MAETDAEEKPRTAKELALALWFPAFFVVGFMLFYLIPFHAPTPNGIAVDVVGAGPAQQVSAQLERAVPGGFEVSPVADAGAIRDSIFERDAVAGYDPASHTLYIAKADGMQLSQVLQGVFGPLSSGGGAPLQVVDLAPTAPGDGFGTALFYIAMAWNISGYIVVMMMMQALTLSRRTKLLALMGFGAAATLVCWTFGIALDAITMHPAVLVVGFLLSQAVAWTTFGLAPFVKRALPGVAMGLFVLLSIPSSGGAIPKEMVPSLFQALHHVLPLGQAIDAARSILYFDGTAVTVPLLGLLAWWAFGAALVALGAWKERRDAAGEPDGDDDRAAQEDEMDRRVVEAVADEASVGGAHRDSLADARLLAHPLPTLIGRVEDPDGEPVPHARITVVDGAGHQLDVSATSRDGRFAVRGDGDGWVTVLVTAPGHTPASLRLRLTGPVAHRSFRLTPDDGEPARPERVGAHRAAGPAHPGVGVPSVPSGATRGA